MIILLIVYSKEIKGYFRKPTKTIDPSIEKKEIKETSFKVPQEIIDVEKINPAIPPHALHFIRGEMHAHRIIQIALFKLYKEEKLLDYESLRNELYSVLNSLSKESIKELDIELDAYDHKTQN